MVVGQQEQRVVFAARRVLDAARLGNARPQWEPFGERQRQRCGCGQHADGLGPELHETEGAARKLGELDRTGTNVRK